MELKRDDDVGIKQRSILWWLVFVGFSVNYMIRINVNIAIVDMLSSAGSVKGPLNVSKTSSECFVKNQTISRPSEDVSLQQVLEKAEKLPSIERKILDSLGIAYNRNGFDWDEKEQNIVLGAFFWFHFLLQLPGGVMASKYGTKLIFGLSNFIGCLLCCLMPIASYLSFELMIGLRILQGIICSASWPSMHHMTGQWIPADERSSFVSAYLGSSMGVAVYYPIFGWIMRRYSWEYIFHFCGVVGLLWWLAWCYFVYDTPELHPRITAEERNYITGKLSSSLNLNDGEESKVRREIPWREILSSKAVWMNTIAQFGGVYGLFTILTQAPSYFRFIHGWDSTMVGIFSGLPHLLRTVMAIGISKVADWLLRREKVTRNNVRRAGTAICCILNGIFILCAAFSGCNAVMACIFIVLATGCHGAVSTGPLAAIIDVSPNYAGVLLGIVNMFCVIPGFVSPIIVSYLTYENQTIHSWQIVFFITAAILIVTGVIYVMFADSSRQPWNKGRVRRCSENCDFDNDEIRELKGVGK